MPSETPGEAPARSPGAVGGHTGDGSTWADRVFHAAFILALVGIAFVGGAIATAAGTMPGSAIARAYEGGRALYARMTQYQNVYRSDLWYPERSPDRGVTRLDPDRAEPGPTIYTSGHAAAAVLVAPDGEVLHEWRRPFSTVWPDGGAAPKSPQPDEFVYFRKVVPFPNGDIIAVYEGVGDTPYGYGLVKLDRNSEVIWRYAGHAHHDVDVGPDGRVYVLTHEFTTDELVNLDRLAPPRLDDFLVILSPDGVEEKKIRLIDLVSDSPYRQVLYTVSSYALADPLHANDVDVITEAQAAVFPFGEAGQVMLSFRELGAIAVIDVDEEKLVWLTRGPWIGQHDPDILANGNILLFDNYGNYRFDNGVSRVIEFDPRTMEIVWQYAGDDADPLDSLIRADQQRLANGNTLITESNGGRIVEVTRNGDIVWEYLNPERHRGDPDGPRIAIVAWANRLQPDFFDFARLAGAAPAFPEPAAPAEVGHQGDDPA